MTVCMCVCVCTQTHVWLSSFFSLSVSSSLASHFPSIVSHLLKKKIGGQEILEEAEILG